MCPTIPTEHSYADLPFEVLRRIFQYVAAIDAADESNLASNVDLDDIVHSHLVDMCEGTSTVGPNLRQYPGILNAETAEDRATLLESQNVALAFGDHTQYLDDVFSLHTAQVAEPVFGYNWMRWSTSRRQKNWTKELEEGEKMNIDQVHAWATDIVYDRLDNTHRIEEDSRERIGGRWHYRIFMDTGLMPTSVKEVVPRTITLETCGSVCTAWRDVALSLLLESQYVDETIDVMDEAMDGPPGHIDLPTVPKIHRRVSSDNAVLSLAYLSNKGDFSGNVFLTKLPHFFDHFKGLTELVWAPFTHTDRQLALLLMLVLDSNITKLYIRARASNDSAFGPDSENIDHWELAQLYESHNLYDSFNASEAFARFKDKQIALRSLTLHINETTFAYVPDETVSIISAFLSVVSPSLRTLQVQETVWLDTGIPIVRLRNAITSNILSRLTQLHFTSVPDLIVPETIGALWEAGIAPNLVQLTLESHNVAVRKSVATPIATANRLVLQPPFTHASPEIAGIRILFDKFLPQCARLEVLSLRGTFVGPHELERLGSPTLCPSLRHLRLESTNAGRWDDLDLLHSAWAAVAKRAVKTLWEWHLFDCCAHTINVIAAAKQALGRGGLKVLHVHSWSWRCSFHSDAMRTLAESVPVVWYGREKSTLQKIIRDFDERVGGSGESEVEDMEMSDGGERSKTDEEDYEDEWLNEADGPGGWPPPFNVGSRGKTHESDESSVNSDTYSASDLGM
ncbi:hypothetical protein BJ742DRAFT_829689 [Cladochytrium replicatum]|nr:hypothetical protein BJ742DRAFT_829689 [Cladochytrium replicatum]